MGSYQTNRVIHFDQCNSYDVFASAGEDSKKVSHGGWEISRGVDGSSHMKIRDQLFPLTAGKTLLYNGNESHEETFSKNENSRIKAVIIHNQSIDRLLREHDIASGEVVFDKIELSSDPVIRSLTCEIDNFRKIKKSSEIAFDSLLVELISHILLNYRHSVEKKLRGLVESGHFPSLVAKAKHLIRKNLFDSNYGLDQLATDTSISKFHLVRTFKKQEGISPMKYKNLLLWEEAKKLLYQSDRKVSEIAFSLGFKDLSTFNKSFRRHSGKRPSDFRA